LPKREVCVKSIHIDEENTNGDGHRNTAGKLPRGKGRPFQKGNDPRRNMMGRPRNFDEVRAVAQSIAHETEQNKLTAIENVLREWRDSPEPSLQKAFVAYAFGKVPDKLETTGLENKTTLVLKFDHERPELAGRN